MHLQNHVVWSWILKCKCEVICDRALNQMLFSMNFYSCGSSHMIKYTKPIVVSDHSAMVSRSCVRPTSKRWFLNLVQVTMKYDQSMPRRNPCDFTSILHSHTSLVPQAQCGVKLSRLCLFHQGECLKCDGHGLLVSCVKWPLNGYF